MLPAQDVIEKDLTKSLNDFLKARNTFAATLRRWERRGLTRTKICSILTLSPAALDVLMRAAENGE